MEPTKPIDYVPLIDNYYQSKEFPAYDWTVNEAAPLSRLSKPLIECTVSMLTSGGISYNEAEPFDPIAKDNFRLDEIAWDTDGKGFQINDAYYDPRDGRRDINVIFPLERLRELAAEGVIGGVAGRLWSGFMGRTYKRGHVVDVAAPAFADELQRDEVDVVVMVPA
ncbi:MAG: glycine/sarcosine/betaine reductase selenoprotein B family protein [Alphaproteobacteria bacterium]|jgi:D-proline reductase (dithiol) PrdB|nr:hypothetical protein [Rhodospirillaceae bacterium]MDP6405988.1 glycine/sarcosine/betaine reductase selenoprotein B family protein [Alphaproteobacteria bacterium]|tara:strand:- start:326 stop:823 length:498 start_codon:yes stop_codon:yes gene_type:complete